MRLTEVNQTERRVRTVRQQFVLADCAERPAPHGKRRYIPSEVRVVWECIDGRWSEPNAKVIGRQVLKDGTTSAKVELDEHPPYNWLKSALSPFWAEIAEMVTKHAPYEQLTDGAA